MAETKKREVSAERDDCAAPEPRTPNPEPRALLGRRDLLKVMTAVPAALAPLASVSAMSTMTMPKSTTGEAAQAAASGAYQPKALNEHEWKTVRVLSDIIIPADDRSGSATEAGVPEFIDDWLDFRGGAQLTAIRGGLTWLDMECNRQFAHDFVDCSEAQQKQITQLSLLFEATRLLNSTLDLSELLELILKIASQEVKDELRRNTDEAISRGVFGVPTLAIGNELFWGVDSTGMAADYVAAGCRYTDPEMARVALLPEGAVREVTKRR